MSEENMTYRSNILWAIYMKSFFKEGVPIEQRIVKAQQRLAEYKYGIGLIVTYLSICHVPLDFDPNDLFQVIPDDELPQHFSEKSDWMYGGGSDDGSAD